MTVNPPRPRTCDVVVVGSGNAGLCAALSAAEEGARTLVLDRAPEEWAGGNSYFTAGAFRLAFEDPHALVDLVTRDGQTEVIRAATDLPTYPEQEFAEDLDRITSGRADPELSDATIRQSADTARWLKGHGVEWTLMYDRQAHFIDDRWQFWGGLFAGVAGQGPALVSVLRQACIQAGVEFAFEVAGVDLELDASLARVTGVLAYDLRARQPLRFVARKGVVLASGGFQANARLRANYLGPGWDVAHVRGTPHNTGILLDRAVRSWAGAAGEWSGAHATAWDTGTAPEGGDLSLTNRATKQGYWLGIVVNREGRRFVDEGADFRNYTYARYGREILAQPGRRAYQIFDSQTMELVDPAEYSAATVNQFQADSPQELARQAGIDPQGFAHTVSQFNNSINSQPFDPTVRDGKAAEAVTPPKSNWAVPIEKPPFFAFEVTCGITFTFGGLKVDQDGGVEGALGQRIDGLHAAGETVGGLFFGNYPGGTGLTAGAVLGRRAGASAAAR